MSVLPKVYLCGGMEYAGDGGAGWRKEATEALHQLGYDVFNPCTDEAPLLYPHGLKNAKEFVNLKYTDVPKFRMVMKHIIDYDLDVLTKCDVVLAYLDQTAIGGASGEMTLAYYMKIPVVGVQVTRDLVGIPGWNLGCVDTLFDSLAKALEHFGQTRYPIK